MFANPYSMEEKIKGGGGRYFLHIAAPLYSRPEDDEILRPSYYWFVFWAGALTTWVLFLSLLPIKLVVSFPGEGGGGALFGIAHHIGTAALYWLHPLPVHKEKKTLLVTRTRWRNVCMWWRCWRVHYGFGSRVKNLLCVRAGSPAAPARHSPCCAPQRPPSGVCFSLYHLRI